MTRLPHLHRGLVTVINIPVRNGNRSKRFPDVAGTEFTGLKPRC